MAHLIDLNTGQTRFDLSTMIQEWVDFLEAQCGYEKADMALVAVLASRHHGLLRTLLHEELGFGWEEVEGLLIIPDYLWSLLEYQQEKLNLHQFDLIWSDCFDHVVEELDGLEEQIARERELGLV